MDQGHRVWPIESPRCRSPQQSVEGELRSFPLGGRMQLQYNFAHGLRRTPNSPFLLGISWRPTRRSRSAGCSVNRVCVHPTLEVEFCTYLDPLLDVRAFSRAFTVVSRSHESVNASRCTCCQMRKYLEQGGDINKTNKLGDTPLHEVGRVPICVLDNGRLASITGRLLRIHELPWEERRPSENDLPPAPTLPENSLLHLIRSLQPRSLSTSLEGTRHHRNHCACPPRLPSASVVDRTFCSTTELPC